MWVVGLPSAFYYIARHLPPDLSSKARERIRWLSCWQALRGQGLPPRRIFDYGITSEPRLAREVALHLACRWFLGYDLDEPTPG